MSFPLIPWITHDQFCLTAMLVYVTAEIGLQLVDVRSAAETWAKLWNLIDSQIRAQIDLLDQQRWDLEKGEKPTAEYLKETTDLCNRFAQLGQPKSVTEINDQLLAGPVDDWEPLCLALSPAIDSTTTESLSSLLLNQQDKLDCRRSRGSPPLSGLTDGTTETAAVINFAAGGQRRGSGSRVAWGSFAQDPPNLQRGAGAGTGPRCGSGYFLGSSELFRPERFSGYHGPQILSGPSSWAPHSQPNRMSFFCRPQNWISLLPAHGPNSDRQHLAPIKAHSVNFCYQHEHAASYRPYPPQNVHLLLGSFRAWRWIGK